MKIMTKADVDALYAKANWSPERIARHEAAKAAVKASQKPVIQPEKPKDEIEFNNVVSVVRGLVSRIAKLESQVDELRHAMLTRHVNTHVNTILSESVNTDVNTTVNTDGQPIEAKAKSKGRPPGYHAAKMRECRAKAKAATPDQPTE